MCPEGTYSAAGAVECSKCPDGQSSESGAKDVSECFVAKACAWADGQICDRETGCSYGCESDYCWSQCDGKSMKFSGFDVKKPEVFRY